MRPGLRFLPIDYRLRRLRPDEICEEIRTFDCVHKVLEARKVEAPYLPGQRCASARREREREPADDAAYRLQISTLVVYDLAREEPVHWLPVAVGSNLDPDAQIDWRRRSARRLLERTPPIPKDQVCSDSVLAHQEEPGIR